MRTAIFITFFVFQTHVFGQTLAETEALMNEQLTLIGEAETRDARIAANSAFKNMLLASFDSVGIFEYPFDGVPKLAALVSPDEKFRLFNWHRPMPDGTNRYDAIVLFPDGKGYVELTDATDLEAARSNKEILPADWYGALYYDIVPVSKKKQDYYVLLGWDATSEITTRKVIDALHFEKNGEPVFGKPVFETEDGYLHRRVFEYAGDVSMTLKYVRPMDAIVFDRLEPLQPGLKGQYQYYGPGTGLSGYTVSKDGTLELTETMDMSRPKEVESEARFNFPDRPDYNRIRGKKNPLTGE